MRGDLDQRLVAQDAVARQIAALGLALTPRGDLEQHGKETRLGRAGLEALPGVLGVLLVGPWIGECGHLLGQPIGPAGLLELFGKTLVDDAKMRYVIERIFELAIAERPARPIGEARGLVDARLGEFRSERFVRHRVAKAGDHRRHLAVEYRCRHVATQMMEDFEILARGVEDLEDAFVGHQFEKRREVHPVGQWIDDRRVVGSGDLHQAEQRPKRGLAHELGVDRDIVRARKARAESRKVVGTGNRFHDPIIGIVARFCPPANPRRSRTLTRAAVPCAFPLARGRPKPASVWRRGTRECIGIVRTTATS